MTAPNKLRDEMAAEFNQHLKSVEKIEQSGMSAWARSANAFKSGYDAAFNDPRVEALLEALDHYRCSFCDGGFITGYTECLGYIACKALEKFRGRE